MSIRNILINGFNELVDKKYLPEYLFKEFKKTENEYYEPSIFFLKCLKSIDNVEQKLIEEYDKKENELTRLINLKMDKDLLEELHSISNGSYRTDSLVLSLCDVYYIRNSIYRAYLKVVPFSKSEVLQLMNTANLKNLPKKLIDRIPPDTRKLISEVIKLDKVCDEMSKDLKTRIENEGNSKSLETHAFESDVCFKYEHLNDKTDEYLENVLALISSESPKNKTLYSENGNNKFVPKTNVEEYLDSDFNFRIYKELTENEDYIGLFDPLDFFNLFEESFNLLLTENKKPLTVTSAILNLKLSKAQLYYLLLNLLQLNQFDEDLKICRKILNDEFLKLLDELYPNRIKFPKGDLCPFNFSKDKKHLESLKDYDDKIKHLIELKTDYLQYGSPYFDDHDIKPYNILCDIEIAKLKELRDIENNSGLLNIASKTNISDNTDRTQKINSKSHNYPNEKIQIKDKTKYEREFFEITERFCFQCTGKEIIPSIDKYNWDLFNIIQRFKDEIIENITTLSQNDREFYLKRISKRVNGIIEAVYALDEKTGETHSLGINMSFNDNDETLTIDPKEIDSYFEMISRYKNEMKEFLSKIFNSSNSNDQTKDKTDDNTDDIPKTFKNLNTIKEDLIKENFIHKISDVDFDPPDIEELDSQIEAKPFPDYFEEKKAEMANICVTVFNKNKSPKEFAIMFCLLIKRGFLSIPDKRRSNYYNSWYNFINRPLPKRNNFNSINKHIEFSHDKGLHFNEHDPDFKRLEQNFNQALIKINE